MVDAHKNFSYSTVATAPVPADSGTTLVVATGGGALFPAAPFNVTIWPAGVQPLADNAEIVRVTDITTDTLTITRAQEGSTARAITAGDQIAATITTKTLTDIETDYIAGPGSATDSNFVMFDTTTGKKGKDGGYSPASFDAAGAAGAVQGNLDTHTGYTASVHGFDASGNAPAQTHGMERHSTISHTALTDIGTNTHAQIDTAVSNGAADRKSLRNQMSTGILTGGTITANANQQDLTGYTETDPNSRITVTTTRATFTGLLNNENAYVYYDFGAAYFSANFNHYFDFNLSSMSNSGRVVIWGMANTVANLKGIIDASGSCLFIDLQRSAGGVYSLNLGEVDSGTAYTSQWASPSVSTTYYVNVYRYENDGTTYGTIYCDIYPTSADRDAWSNVISSLSVVLHTSMKNYQYLYGLQSYNNATTTSQSGYVELLKLRNKFNIAAGTGVVVNNYTDPANPTLTSVSWSDQTLVTPTNLLVGEETYVGFNSSGTLVQQTTYFSNSDRRDIISNGVVGHSDSAAVDYIINQAEYMNDIKASSNDFFENFGPFNISGNEFSPNGANLMIDRSAGEAYDTGINYENSKKSPHVFISSPETACMLTYYYTVPGGSWFTEWGYTEIDPWTYDTLNGTAAVPVNKWTIQTIFYYPYLNSVDVQYGQALYGSKAEAKSNLLQSIVVDEYLSYDVFRCWLIVKYGATDLSDPNQAEFVSAGKLGLVSVAAGGGASGEVNTASNVGTAGVGFFDSKVGIDLQFKNAEAASTKITVTDYPTNKTVRFDVATGTTSGTVCAGDDSRLSDARTPTTHDNTKHSTAYAAVSEIFSGLAKITVGLSAPGSPGVGDLWIDTN